MIRFLTEPGPGPGPATGTGPPGPGHRDRATGTDQDRDRDRDRATGPPKPDHRTGTGTGTGPPGHQNQTMKGTRTGTGTGPPGRQSQTQNRDRDRTGHRNRATRADQTKINLYPCLRLLHYCSMVPFSLLAAGSTGKRAKGAYIMELHDFLKPPSSILIII